jgi:small subunit ribosomal protein S16
MSNPSKFTVDAEKVTEWISKGAQVTDTVKALLKKNGVIS